MELSSGGGVRTFIVAPWSNTRRMGMARNAKVVSHPRLGVKVAWSKLEVNQSIPR